MKASANSRPNGVILAGAWACRWRLELALGALLVGVFFLVFALPLMLGALLVGAVGETLRRARARLSAALGRAALRRAWRRAILDCSGPACRARAVTVVPRGERLDVEVRAGQPVSKLESIAEALAGCLHVRAVEVKRNPLDGSRADVTLVRRDPFEDYIENEEGQLRLRPLTWPPLEADWEATRR